MLSKPSEFGPCSAPVSPPDATVRPVAGTVATVTPQTAAHAAAEALRLHRPLLRGWLHVAAFVASIPIGIVLVAMAHGANDVTAAAIYAGSMALSFGTSASYHRLARSPRAHAIMRRLDHSAIYLLIAGTYVPFCLVALPRRWGVPLLAAVCAAAVVGMVLKLAAFHRIPWLGYTLYPAMGWAALAATPALLDHLSSTELALLVAGGVAYTVGFPVLLLKRPDPWPNVFGYHEVWHAFTVVAAGLHVAAVASLLTGPA